jgi:hypothetical protein
MDKLVTLRGKYQAVLDKLTPFILYRWLCFGIMISLFLARIFLAQGFYIIAYVLFIYLLNLFILFLQPQVRRKKTISIRQQLSFRIGMLLPPQIQRAQPFLSVLPMNSALL